MQICFGSLSETFEKQSLSNSREKENSLIPLISVFFRK